MANEQKKKILYLMKILMEQTDEQHIMTAGQLCKALEGYGISAERKGIYRDIETLQDFGIDIVQLKGKTPGYYVASRDFELPELKLLVDLVQASKFITTKKSEELIKKLEGLTNKHEAKQLQRNVFIYNRPKAGNETIYYNVDHIHNALFENVQIAFQYVGWTMKKEQEAKRGGAWYQVSPWALTWADENYYLIAYDEKANLIKHYRVDKMINIRQTEEKRIGKEQFENFDIAAFAKKTFAMFGGQDDEVTLLCHKSLAGVVLDRFGKEVWMTPVDAEHFRVRTLVSVSPQFFGWVTGLGSGVQITGPERVRQRYKEYLEQIMENYK